MSQSFSSVLNNLERKWVYLIILIFSFMLYGNTLQHEYTQDDAIVIYDNMFTQKGINGIFGHLTNDTFFGFFKEKGKSNLVSGGRYRPFTPVLFCIEYELFGLKPFYGHLFNILWFAILGFLVFLVTQQIILKSSLAKDSSIISILVTIIFLAHPVHTEAVANIKGRDEILALLGSLTALFFSTKYVYSKHKKHLWYAGIAFFIGLMSKENTITFLAIIPLALMLFHQQSFLKSIKLIFPIIVATLFFLGCRTAVLGFDFGSAPNELMNNPFLKLVGNNYIPFSFEEKFATICTTLIHYLRLLFYPMELTHDYYPRHIAIMNFGHILPWLGLLVNSSLLILSIYLLKKDNVISFSILFYLLSLSIVSNIIFPVGTNMSERFLFMPSYGFALFIVSFLFKILDKKYNLILMLIIGLGIVFSLKTISRNTVWKDDFTLFTTDAKTSVNSAKVQNAAGGALTTEAFKLPDGVKKTKMLNQAVFHLNKALEIHPYYKNPYLILGNAYNFLGKYPESISAYESALKLDPNYKEAIKNLAITLRDAGRIAGEKERNLDKSIKYLSQSISLSQTDSESYRLLGVAYGIKGDHLKAIDNFKKVIDLNPENGGAYLNLSNAYKYIGDEENARIMLEKALSLDPNILKK